MTVGAIVGEMVGDDVPRMSIVGEVVGSVVLSSVTLLLLLKEDEEDCVTKTVTKMIISATKIIMTAIPMYFNAFRLFEELVFESEEPPFPCLSALVDDVLPPVLEECAVVVSLAVRFFL